MPRFLLIADTHFATEGSEIRFDDLKVTVPGIGHPTREEEIEKVFRKIANDLQQKAQRLDGVLFAGDAQRRGLPGGHQILFDLILASFRPFGIEPNKIVATPGNHDVQKGSRPASSERYDAFVSVWRNNNCVTPWLDGVDDSDIVDGSKHFLAADDHSWSVFPLNTSNWSQVRAEIPEPLLNRWSDIPSLLTSDMPEQNKLRRALDGLLDYDMAHVSDLQLEALRSVITKAPMPAQGPQLRILLMHHHLRVPSLRVELKPFENISNLEQVRTFIGQTGIDLVIHGHKHEHSTHFEYVGGEDNGSARRIAVLSAGTIDNGRDTDAARILKFEGLPYTPELHSKRFGLPRGGLDVPVSAEPPISLWNPPSLQRGPTIIQGSDFSEVYARSAKAARQQANKGILIVHLDLPVDAGLLNLPDGYPEVPGMSAHEKQQWLSDIVNWWQLPQSHRDRIFPYPHGSRLRRYGGMYDQIERLDRMLQKSRSSPTVSSRALAVLVDPIRDFSTESESEAFPSFTILQIKKHQAGPVSFLDVIGFYRAQEFSQWWPINIAELRSIQIKLCKSAAARPGRITTITTEARLEDRAPGQVHVPIFDRWLDQTPQRLFLLASLLVGEIKDHPKAVELLEQWRQALNDFLIVAGARNADGSPISSQGLKALRDYIVILRAPDQQQPNLLASLESLIDACEAFESSARDAKSFEVWARNVQRVIPQIVPGLGGE